MDHILRHLKIICKLLQTLENDDLPTGVDNRRVYGPMVLVRLRVEVNMWPTWPNTEKYDPRFIRNKYYRIKLAACLEERIIEILGRAYKVKVRIDNV